MSEQRFIHILQDPEKQIKAAIFDGDGVVLKIPKEHPHEAAARIHGVDLAEINDELFGSRYSDVLHGKLTFGEHISALRQTWGDNDPRTLVAESLNVTVRPQDINYPLLEKIQPFRQTGMFVCMGTVQGPERFHMMHHYLHGYFDRFFATCEMGVLKVEDEDKHEVTQQLLEKPSAPYFTYILGGLALAPENIAFFDDRADNIEIARRKGINAHLYESPDQVEAILSQ